MEAPKETVPGDVVQIAPEGSTWAKAFFMTVTEVKHWGVCGYVMVVSPDGKPGLAYLRVEHGHYERIGESVWSCQLDLDRGEPELPPSADHDD